MELDELAEGYRFHPTDSELLTFLLRFIAKIPLRDDGFITEHDIYKQEPWETYNYGQHCGGQDNEDTCIYRYFITPRQRKGSNFCRIVGEKLGTWKQQDKGKNVTMTGDNKSKTLIIGRMKSMCYETTKCYHDDRDNGKWLMKEYVFCDAVLRKFKNSEYKDYVICAIKMIPKKRSSSQSSNVTTIDSVEEPMVDVEVTSGVNSIEPLMDQEYKVITPINIVEPMVESSGETTSSQILESLIADSENAMSENNDLDTLDEDYEMASPINIVEEPMVEFDDLEVQIDQEAAGEESGCVLGLTTSSQIQEFENATPEINLPKENDRLTENTLLDKNSTLEGCISGVKEDYIAYLEHEAKGTSFVELLTIGRNSAMRNTFTQIQEPVIPDFGNAESEINMPEILNTLAEYMENNVPEMFDMGDTLLEKDQAQHQPQEESETPYETEESSLIYDLVEDMLDHATMKDRLDAIRMDRTTLMLDQQSWLSKTHLQDMLL
ncbi:hypothetical protein RND71_022122 [Anisodus tanguticus]|uniref:NAC domain-containing protein n=1 Tax=Anisodus tanguticus TaxID=243964 RepID=A0AAE1RXV7_9SOLA|nr:hypothetical protein RND71_022122 [Anisodus tanguticus]